MRSKMVRRYYCDFCPKSGCNSGHIRKHEQHCVYNPTRECRMCPRIGEVQAPTSALEAALESGGLKELRRVAAGCPVCVLAGIVAWKKRWKEQGADEEETWVDGFDFKAEMKAAWEQIDNAAWESEVEGEKHQLVSYGWDAAEVEPWPPF